MPEFLDVSLPIWQFLVVARRRMIMLARLNLSIAITVAVLGPMLVSGVRSR